MEQFLYWAKTNSKSGSAIHGDEVVGPPPPLPSGKYIMRNPLLPSPPRPSPESQEPR